MANEDPTSKPSFEDRLQAVIESLELTAAMQRDHEKHLAEADQRWSTRLDKLLTIVESHERRISGLEGQQ